MGRDDRAGTAAASMFAYLVVLAIVLALVLCCFATVKATELVIRVMRQNPQNAPLRIALSAFLIAFAVVIGTSGQQFTLNVLAVLSLLALLLVAKIFELRDSQYFEEELSWQAALHDPWWSIGTDPAAKPASDGHSQSDVPAFVPSRRATTVPLARAGTGRDSGGLVRW